jgi:hypothetical protein
MNEYRDAADELGNLAIFDAGLLLTTAVTGFQLTEKLAQEASSDTRAQRAADRSLRLLLQRLPVGSGPGQLYRFRRLVELLRLKPNLNCILHETALIAHRPEEDWYTRRLPDYMMWAHYVLRFVSLMHRGVGGSRRSD